MNISKFDYTLPRELIAQKPANPRDLSRLLVLDRKTGEIRHTVFNKIVNYLTANDVLVFNKSKVFPARLYGRKKSKGKVEILILKFIEDKTIKLLNYQTICEVITKPGLFLHDIIYFEGFTGKVVKRDGYITLVEFNLSLPKLLRKINLIGHTPIPPYINKATLSETDLRKKYQTVYAKSVGSAAAPTAGLHFTKELLKKLNKKGVQMEFVTLHVGLGTFAPVKENDIKKHKIHKEYFDVDENTIKRLDDAKRKGKRIIAVGTTTARVLETLATDNNSLYTIYDTPYTNLYIYPPYRFRFVDSMITNFHLPKSTLLALISAFVSYPNTDRKFSDFCNSSAGKAYSEAIEKEYRFFSFGDGMFIK